MFQVFNKVLCVKLHCSHLMELMLLKMYPFQQKETDFRIGYVLLP